MAEAASVSRVSVVFLRGIVWEPPPFPGGGARGAGCCVEDKNIIRRYLAYATYACVYLKLKKGHRVGCSNE